MRKNLHLVWFIAGILVGVIAVASYRPALAQAINPTIGTWQYGESHWSQVNSAWRVNTVTGAMELCSAYDGKPTCFVMPKPNF